MEVTQRRYSGGNAGKWSSTRQGAIVIALLSALVAAGILVYALNRYRQSVSPVSRPATVLVATRLIEKGSSGAAIGVGQYFRITKILEKQVSPGALASTAALHGEVAATDIYPGQQLTAGDFVGGGLFYSRLPPNLRAVSVPVDTAHGMIGNVQTSDRVDVYVSFAKEAETPAFVRLVAPDVVVLDAGKPPPSAGIAGAVSPTTATSNVVLEVSIHEAAELAFSADYGKVWLVLRPPGGSSPSGEIVNELSILAHNPPASSGGTK